MNTLNKKHLSFSDVFSFVSRYWLQQPIKLSLFLGFYVVACLFEIYMPKALAHFLEAIRLQASLPVVLHSLYVFIVICLMPVGMRFLSFLFYNNFETRVFKALMTDAFTHVHRLSSQFFSDNFAGAIISKITRARTRIENFEDNIFHRFFPTFIILIGSLVLMAQQFPLLALFLGFYVIMMVLVSFYLVTRIMKPAQLAYTEALDLSVARVADNISGIATTKAFAQESREISQFSDVLEDVRRKNHRTYFLGNFCALFQNIFLVGMLALLLGGGVWYFTQGKAHIEDLAYLSLAYTIMQSYLRQLSDHIKDIITSSYDLHGAILLMREVPKIQDRPEAPAAVFSKGSIAFSDVTFAYPGSARPIFEKFSVSIRAGERVALVGRSGSGKTTFLRLLQRFYDVQEGSISIDGQDIAACTQESLRKQMALVPQDPILFHRSLRENIAYAKPGANLAEISLAAAQASIDAFIQSLPQKYETFVGERGVKLSGGERQRVAIARAILADKPILLLDEATSSLDSNSEKAIQFALHKLIQGRTAVMIAHRLSTILDADRILVFERGKIVEEGTHVELLAEGGIYAKLFKLQSGGFLGDETGNPALEDQAS